MTTQSKVQPQKPTLKSIARITGLAVPTVSRALSDAPDISIETKNRVRLVAKEINYVPNRAGVRLRTGRTNVVSLVLPTEVNMMNHTARLISSITQTLQGTSFHLNIMPWMEGDDAMKPIRNIVENRLADGIILNSTTPEDPRVAYMQEEGFPFATHGRTRHSDNHPYYDFDNYTFAKNSVKALYYNGCRHILALLPPSSMNYSRHMYDGCHDAAQELGIKIEVLSGTNADSDQETIHQHTLSALQGNPHIDGMIASAPMGCMSMVAACEKLGRVIGEDIEIASREAIPFLKLFRPKLLITHEDVGKAGAFLAQAILKAINQPEAPPMQGLDIPKRDLLKPQTLQM